MPEIYLKQPGFTYGACSRFTKTKERIEKFMQTGNTDKACFPHDMGYGKLKDLAKRTWSDKFLRDKAFEVASNPKYDGYQRGLVLLLYKFSDKKSTASDVSTEPNYQLANGLHRQIIRKFIRRKVYLNFGDNIWGIDLADMQWLSKYDRGIRYLLCAVDLLLNMHGLFLWKKKEELVLLMYLKK